MAFAKAASAAIIPIGDFIRKAESEEAVQKNRSWLIMGGSGTGKTFSELTIPSAERGLIMDFDNKAENIRAMKPSNLDIAPLNVGPSNAAEMFDMTESIVEEIVVGKLEYQWGFLDSQSSFFDLIAYNSHDNVKGDNKFKLNYDKQDWVKDKMWRIITRLFGSIQNTVLMCHESGRSDVEGNLLVLPLSIKSISEKLPSRFQNNFHASTRGGGNDIIYVWETRPEGSYRSNTSIFKLPYLVPNHFDFILSTDWVKFTGESLDTVVKDYEQRTGRKITNWKTSLAK